ncbi:VOC family protein [Sphingomonas sp. 1P06PA]|uniref:VOC family protein n=1 Tax=Sphingomonas sp. 1P06PA TaxID=554121 RepID=UPI0039A4EB89
MLDHIGVAVSNAERSRLFYQAALAPLGISLIQSIAAADNGSGGAAHGFGTPGDPWFWVGDNERVGEGTHIAFRAKDRAAVRAFHQAALAAGGVDHGGPGLRPHYGSDYYAAFVLDPDGINIEAVCRERDEG